MARSIWNGSLSFGLVNIPISVYPGSEEHELSFHMLHKKDLSPIRFARICKHEEKEIPYSEIVKGYEYEKGEYVVIADEDFKNANAKKTSTIEIQQFTDIESINPIFYDRPYYLEPNKKAEKAYALLHEALKKSQKVAIVNYVFKNREHIGAIIATKEGLLLMQMRFFSEIRSQEFSLPKQKISDQELKMAKTLIEEATKPFSPEKYHDTYTEELMAVIDQKFKGKKTKRKSKEVPSHMGDLMSLLQESLKKTLKESHKEKKSHFLIQSKKTTPRRKSRS